MLDETPVTVETAAAAVLARAEQSRGNARQKTKNAKEQEILSAPLPQNTPGGAAQPVGGGREGGNGADSGLPARQLRFHSAGPSVFGAGSSPSVEPRVLTGGSERVPQLPATVHRGGGDAAEGGRGAGVQHVYVRPDGERGECALHSGQFPDGAGAGGAGAAVREAGADGLRADRGAVRVSLRGEGER